jgi:hypothetical protein
MLETKFNRSQLWYAQKRDWTFTDLQYGVITTSDTPAAGFIAAGSHIPGGRFLAAHPDNISATSRLAQKAILPDLLGTSLIKDDGTDYSDIIAGALTAGDFNFIGVSVVRRGDLHDICMRATINEQNKRNGLFPSVVPNGLIGSQPWPIGYTWPESIDNYWNYGDNVSAVQQDRITLYTEQDINIGDPVFVRVDILLPMLDPPQLLGGVTNVADAGTQPVTGFNLRVTKPAKAGSAVELQLN